MSEHTTPDSPREITADAPLAGIRVVSVALNVPGPVAVRRLQDLGAQVALVDPESSLGYALRLCDWTVVETSKDLEMLRAPEDWRQSDGCGGDE